MALAEEQDALGSLVTRQLSHVVVGRDEKRILRETEARRKRLVGPALLAKFAHALANALKITVGNECLNFRETRKLVEIREVPGPSKSSIGLESGVSSKELLGEVRVTSRQSRKSGQVVTDVSGRLGCCKFCGE